ncbi:hypothetical protein BGZ73_001137 [Actinomortierella ambigua]|nr:hypothetical protein BGZ73_001137 [Actinomortierella ambigua]
MTIPPPPIAWEASGYEVKNGWIVDEYGRAIILHGLNLSGGTKMPFYRPTLHPVHSNLPPTQNPVSRDGPISSLSPTSNSSDSNNNNNNHHAAATTGADAGEVAGVIYSYKEKHFFDHRHVSFVNRPFPLSEADTHFARLALWGSQCLRLLVPWEALEHSGPGEYDEEYIQYLVDLLAIAAKYRLKCFIDPHVDCWSRFTGGSGMPGWTLELVGLDMTKFQDTGAAVVQNTAAASDKEDYPHMIWATNSHKLAASTMYTLFFAGQVFAPKALVPLDNITLTYLREIHGAIEAEHEFRQGHGSLHRQSPVSPTQHLIPVPALLDGPFLERGRINIQHFLQAHYLTSYVHLAKRFRDVEDSLHLIAQGTVMGFDTMNEPSPGYLNHPDLTKLLDLADLKVGVCPTPFQGMLLAAGRTVTCEDWTTGQIGPWKRGSVKVNVNKTSLWKRPVWSDETRHPSLPLGDGFGVQSSNDRHRALRLSVLPTMATNLLQTGQQKQQEQKEQPPNAEGADSQSSQGWPTPARYSTECLWAQHGVWDSTVGLLIQPHYFERIPRRPTRLGFGDGGTASTTATMVHRATIPFQYRPGELVEWKADFWLPFVNTMTLLLRQQDTRFLMFVEPPINEQPPPFRFHRELAHNIWHGATDWHRIRQRLRALIPIRKGVSKKTAQRSKDDSKNSKNKATQNGNDGQRTHNVHELYRLEAPLASPRRRANNDQVPLAPLERLRQHLDQTTALTIGEGDIRSSTDGGGNCGAPLPKQWGWCAKSEQHAVFDEHGDVSHNLVAAPHFYDGYTNITRDFVPFTLDYLGYKEGLYSNVLAALHFGWQAVGRVWQQQVGMIARDVHMSIGPHVAVLMGETGLPMDLHDRASYKHRYGDPKQDFAMGLLLRAMDDSRLSYTLWNYCSDNSHRWGDRWNGEDFSVWSEPENSFLVAEVEQAMNKEKERAKDNTTADSPPPLPPRKKTLTELASELPLETTGCSEGFLWWCCVPRGVVWIRQKRALLASQGTQASADSSLTSSPTHVNGTTNNTASTTGFSISGPLSVSGSNPSAVSSSTGLIQQIASPPSSAVVAIATDTPVTPPKPVNPEKEDEKSARTKKKPLKVSSKKSIEWQDLLPSAVRYERLRPEYRGLRSAENFVRAYPLATRGEPVFFRFEPGRTVKQHLLDHYSTVAVVQNLPLPSSQASPTSSNASLATLGSPSLPSFLSPEAVDVIQKAQKQCWETRFSLVVKLTCKAVAELQAKEAKRRQTKNKQQQQPKQQHKQQRDAVSHGCGMGADTPFVNSTDIFLPRFHFPLDSSAGLLHFEPFEDSEQPNNDRPEKTPSKAKPVMGRWHQLEICGTDGWWAIDSDRQVLRYWPVESDMAMATGDGDDNGTSGMAERQQPLSTSTQALSPLQQVAEAKDPALSDMERRLVALQAMGWDEQKTPGVTCAKEQEWIQQWFKTRKQNVKNRASHKTKGGAASRHATGAGHQSNNGHHHQHKGKETVVIASPCSDCGQAQVMHLHGLTVAVKIWQGPRSATTSKQKEE